MAAPQHANSLLSIRHLNSHARSTMIYELFARAGRTHRLKKSLRRNLGLLDEKCAIRFRVVFRAHYITNPLMAGHEITHRFARTCGPGRSACS